MITPIVTLTGKKSYSISRNTQLVLGALQILFFECTKTVFHRAEKCLKVVVHLFRSPIKVVVHLFRSPKQVTSTSLKY